MEINDILTKPTLDDIAGLGFQLRSYSWKARTHPAISSLLPRVQIGFRSDNQGLVDFDVSLVEFILHLPDRQVKLSGEIFL